MATRGDILPTIQETGDESTDGMAGRFGKNPATPIARNADSSVFDTGSLSGSSPDLEETLPTSQQDTLIDDDNITPPLILNLSQEEACKRAIDITINANLSTRPYTTEQQAIMEAEVHRAVRQDALDTARRQSRGRQLGQQLLQRKDQDKQSQLGHTSNDVEDMVQATLLLQDDHKRTQLKNAHLATQRGEAKRKLAQQKALLETEKLRQAAEEEELSLLKQELQDSKDRLAEVQIKREQTRQEAEAKRAAAEQLAERHRTLDIEGQKAAEEEEELLRQLQDKAEAGRADAEGKRGERES
jgi:hypothetical protein